jgi:peptidyl-prolyl cis-trans isomerase D
MLQSIHDNAKGWIAYAIVFLISIPFAFFGIQSYLGGGSEKVVAVVNGDEIGLQRVQREVSQQKQRIIQMFGKIPSGFDDSGMKRSALEDIVNQTLLRQQAMENNYRASATEVVNALAIIPAFQKEGRFDAETYRQAIALQRRNAKAVEEQVRSSITNNQFNNAITSTAFLPKAEMENYQKLVNQKRDVEVYTLILKDKEAGIEVTDEMIQKHYNDNKNVFQTEEQVKVTYVELKQKEVAEALSFEDSELQQYYDENIERYKEKGQFKASHIRINITDKLNQEQAKQQATALHAAIVAGEKTFDDVAAMKDDALFAELGEKIGFVDKGTMNKAFEDTVFNTKEGEVAEPIQTPDGFEIIKVLALKQERQKSFEQVKADVSKHLSKEKSEEKFEDLRDVLRTSAFENDGSLQPAIDAIKGKQMTSDWFSRSTGEGVGANPAVKQAAFGAEVLSEGKNSSLIEIASGHVVVVRLEENKKPALKPLTDVSTEIKALLVTQQGKKQLEESGKKLLAAVKATKGWAALGEDKIASVVKYTNVARDGDKVSAHITRALFDLAASTSLLPLYTSVTAPNGDYSIIALVAVKSGEVAIDDAAKQQYAGYVGNREQRAVMQALRDQADVELYPERLSEE